MKKIFRMGLWFVKCFRYPKIFLMWLLWLYNYMILKLMFFMVLQLYVTYLYTWTCFKSFFHTKTTFRLVKLLIAWIIQKILFSPCFCQFCIRIYCMYWNVLPYNSNTRWYFYLISFGTIHLVRTQNVCVLMHIMGLEMLVFRNILHTY